MILNLRGFVSLVDSRISESCLRVVLGVGWGVWSRMNELVGELVPIVSSSFSNHLFVYV